MIWALLTLCMLCAVAEGSSLVDVYRLLQYDVDGEHLGSRRVALNQHASLVGVSGGRSVIVIPFAEIDIKVVTELLESKTSIAGLLFVLPRDFEGIGKSALHKLEAVEQLLLESKVQVPVYFAEETADLNEMISSLEPARRSGSVPSASTGGVRLVVSAREAKPLAQPLLENYQAWLHAKSPTSSSGSDEVRTPTIAIVAHYDTLGVTPPLARGADSNGSGVATLLGLLKLFSSLYKDARTKGEYNLVFVLTAGGPLNFAGSEHWLDTVDMRVLETLEFVLCLDSIAGSGGSLAEEEGEGGEGLFLHISRPPKEDAIKSLYSEFESVAEQHSVPFTIKHKKVNISAPSVSWEHEQYAKRKIVAATLSASRAPPFHPALTRLRDTHSPSSQEKSNANVARTVAMVGEALVRFMYDHPGRPLLPSPAKSPASAFTSQWMHVLASTPRAVPHYLTASFTSQTSVKGGSVRSAVSKPFSSVATAGVPHASSAAPATSPQAHFAGALRAAFAEFGTQCSAQPFRLDPAVGSTRFTFYDSASAQLEIYKVASIMFDIYAAIAVVTYLALLWLVLGICTRGLQDTLQSFNRHPVRKHKNN